MSILAASGCLAHLEVRDKPAAPFEGVIVLGCPSKDDGTPTGCQLGRALYAAIVWERGYADHFITSGSSVATPYVEAEAIAQLMVAAGVPPDRIYLEPNALHTDENVYNSLQIAGALGWQRLAVLSDKGHAAFGCQFAIAYGRECGALSVERDAVIRKHQQLRASVDGVRASPDPAFLPLADRERQIFHRTGRRRPPSFVLYPSLAIMATNGERWIPNAPPTPPILRYDLVLAGRREKL